jgi:hypothetical protein
VKSILDRLTGRHLDDAAFAELWTAGGGSRDSIKNSHLDHCAECRVRFAAFASWMEEVRDGAIADADEAFPAERLAAQHAQIFKRIEAAEHPARVIVFPKFSTVAMGRQSSVHRWVTFAAAAGLIIGIGLGNLMDLRHLGALRDMPPAVKPVDNVARGVKPTAATVSEEALWQELQAADAPQYDALRPFDTFTPRAADFVTSSR